MLCHSYSFTWLLDTPTLITPAFIGDPAIIDVKLLAHPAFIRGQALIRTRRLIEEIRYANWMLVGLY